MLSTRFWAVSPWMLCPPGPPGWAVSPTLSLIPNQNWSWGKTAVFDNACPFLMWLGWREGMGTLPGANKRGTMKEMSWWGID